MERRNTTALILIVAVAFFFFVLDPIGLFRSKPHLQKPAVSPTELSTLSKSYRQEAKSPQDYLTGLFGSHEVVFLGEMGEIREQVDFVAGLIPDLYRHGVHLLGTEYALSSDQSKIDRILTAKTYDEKAVQQVLFDRMVLWGFKEYANLFHAAWKLNSSLPAGSPPFRILGLNVRQEYKYLQNQNDANNPDIVKKVFANGVPDVHMADVIDSTIVAKGEKALIYTSIQHAFTRFRYKNYEEKSRKAGLGDGRSAGNIVRDRIGDKAVTVLFHSPWPDTSGPGGMGYPVGGTLDALLESLPEGERTGAMTITGTPIGKLPVKNQAYAYGYQSLTLEEMTTGYLFLGPIASYHAVTPIPGFIDSGDLAQAVTDFPGPTINPKTSTQDLNGFISRMSDTISKSLANFK